MSKDKSIWELQGDFYWNSLSTSQKKELDDILEDMKIIYSTYRVVRIKQIMTKIIEAKESASTSSLSYRWTSRPNIGRTTPINEWDLKDFAITANDILEHENLTWEELEKNYQSTQEEIQVALSYISGIFSNSRIWKGHIDLLRSYKRRLELGIPLTERQAETLLVILKRYSKQIVSNTIL